MIFVVFLSLYSVFYRFQNQNCLVLYKNFQFWYRLSTMGMCLSFLNMRSHAQQNLNIQVCSFKNLYLVIWAYLLSNFSGAFLCTNTVERFSTHLPTLFDIFLALDFGGFKEPNYRELTRKKFLNYCYILGYRANTLLHQ